MKKSYLIVFTAISIISGWLGGSAFNTNGKTNESVQNHPKTAFERVAETKTLRCGYVQYPPYFEISLQTGKPAGIMVDLMEEIGRKLDVKVEWAEEANWGTMFEGLKTGRYDAVCSMMWQTPARAMHAELSAPIGYASMYSYVRSDNHRLSADPAKLNNKDVRIATMDGEINDLLAQSLFPQAKRIAMPQYSSATDLFMNVVTGKVDVLFQEEKTARVFLKNNPGAIRRLGDQPLAVYPMGMALPAGDTRLKAVIDSALAEIVNSPKYDQILAGYGGLEELGFKKPAAPYLN
jgi:ABC-type amino acid transport substrate-binding protein